jgi:hypothetical protein
MKNFSPNIEYKLDLSIIDEVGNFVSGLTIDYEIRKSSDNSLVDSGIMTEVGDLYVISYTFLEVGQYRILYFTPEGYENGSEEILVSSILDTALTEEEHNKLMETATEETLTEQSDILRRILGLNQENFRIFNPTYDINHNLLSSTIKIYPTKADCLADTNAIATYSVIATYENENMKTYRVTKE